MEETDRELAERVRDVVAVAAEDIDTITVAVEDGVAYIEGVVENKGQRQAIISAVEKIAGLNRVISCLATEHVLPRSNKSSKQVHVPPPVLMHRYSRS
jgi:osmotically-inducible protein OsmY